MPLCEENFIWGEIKGKGQVTNLKKEVYNNFFLSLEKFEKHSSTESLRRLKIIAAQPPS